MQQAKQLHWSASQLLNIRAYFLNDKIRRKLILLILKGTMHEFAVHFSNVIFAAFGVEIYTLE